MNFSSTHRWNNGAITVVEYLGKDKVNLRIQSSDETMLADVVMGEYEILCLAHSILSVLTNDEPKEKEKHS